MLHDSGSRKKFESGAVREISDSKGRFDLISPIAIFRLSKIMAAGAKKYELRNWEQGMPLSVFLDSASRHLEKIKLGMNDEDHLAAVLFNISAFIHTKTLIDMEILPKELDDAPKTFENVDTETLKKFGFID